MVAVAAFVILLLAVLLVERGGMERGTEKLDLTSVDASNIDGLAVREGEQAIAMQKVDGVWRLESGRLADRTAIGRAVDAIAAIDSSDVISSSPERHAEYGVADDAPVVTLRAGNRVAAELVVGEPGRSGGSYVRQAGDDTVFRVEASLRHLLPTDQKRWLQLRLVDAELDDVTSITVNPEATEAYTLVPGDKGTGWALADPSQLPADFRFDHQGAERLARTAVNLRATELVEDPPADDVTGLGGDSTTVAVSIGDKVTTMHLGATAEDGSVWASVDGRDAVFQVPTFQASSLSQPFTSLRDLRLAPFDADKAVALEVVDGSRRFAFSREPDGQWAVAEGAPQPPADLELDPAAVQRVVASLAGLRGESTDDRVSAGGAGLDQPRTTADVTLDDGTQARISFGSSTTVDGRDFDWASGSADDHVYRVATAYRTRLARGWEAYRHVEPPAGAGGNPFANLDPETLKNLPPDVRKSIIEQMQQEQRKQKMLRRMNAGQGGPPAS
jgi:hypothetical protein